MLKTLTVGLEELWDTENNFSVISGFKADAAGVIKKIILSLLMGWRNFRNSAGEIVDYVNDLRIIPGGLIHDIYLSIMDNSRLSEADKTGLRILAGLHSGQLKNYSCDGCGRTPSLLVKRGSKGVYDKAKKFLGCNPIKGGADWAVFDEDIAGDEIEYHHCPILFITPSVNMWYKIYSYRKEHPSTAPEYKDQTARYAAAVRYYERELGEQNNGR